MNKLKITTYLACAIEHGKSNSQDWKIKLKKDLNSLDVGIYDPVEQEANKTGKPVKETGEYIKGLKRGGHWTSFHKEMEKIWWGRIEPAEPVEVFKLLRYRKLIDGNEKQDFQYWGDYEAVIRSDFIIAYLEANVKTVGTICEIHTAFLLHIPVYLIIPDQTKTDCNSTLIDLVVKSGGEIFYSVSECTKFIKEKYKI